MTVVGSNFGPVHFPAKVTIGGEECTKVEHLSHGEIECLSPAAVEAASSAAVAVTVANLTGVNENVFVYEKPSVKRVVPDLVPFGESGTLMILGSFLGTASENVSLVTIGGSPCENVSIYVDDTALECDFTPGVGRDLPVVVVSTTGLSRPIYDRRSNMDVSFSFGEEVKQIIVAAELDFGDQKSMLTETRAQEVANDVLDALVDSIVQRSEKTNIGKEVAKDLDKARDQARRSSHGTSINQSISSQEITSFAHILGRDPQVYRSAYHSKQVEMVFVFQSESVANLVFDALNASADFNLTTLIALDDFNLADVTVNRIWQNASVYCPPGQYRTGYDGSFFCSLCPEGEWQPFATAWGEKCYSCEEKTRPGIDCRKRGTPIPPPLPGYWRNLIEATQKEEL